MSQSNTLNNGRSDGTVTPLNIVEESVGDTNGPPVGSVSASSQSNGDGSTTRLEGESFWNAATEAPVPDPPDISDDSDEISDGSSAHDYTTFVNDVGPWITTPTPSNHRRRPVVNTSNATSFDLTANASALGAILQEINLTRDQRSSLAARLMSSGILLGDSVALNAHESPVLSPRRGMDPPEDSNPFPSRTPSVPGYVSTTASIQSGSRSSITTSSSFKRGGGSGKTGLTKQQLPRIKVPLVKEDEDAPPVMSSRAWLNLSGTFEDALSGRVSLNQRLSAKERLQLKPGNHHEYKTINEITKPLDPLFGVSKGMPVKNREDGDASKKEHIQTSVSNSVEKVERLVRRAVEFSLQSSYHAWRQNPTYNKEELDPKAPWSEIFLPERLNVLDDWNKIPLKEVCWSQKAMNVSEFVNEVDRNGCDYLYKIIHNSCTTALLNQLDKKFNTLPSDEQGGLTYLWLLLNHIFFMSSKMETDLKEVLRIYEEKGPASIDKQENYSGHDGIGPQLTNVITLLGKNGLLTSDSLKKLLTGGSLSGNETMRDMCKSLQVDHNLSIIDEFTGIGVKAPQDSIMEKCLALLERKQRLHGEEVTNGQEFVTSVKPKDIRINNFQSGNDTPDRSCFNCGQLGCSVGKCAKPKDQARITKNRLAFQAAKEARIAKEGSGSGQHKTVPTRNTGEKFQNGKAFVFCGPCAAYTDTHSTKYHAAWAANPSTFNIRTACPGHPLCVEKKSKSDFPIIESATAPSGTAGANSSGGVSQMNALIDAQEKAANSESQVQMCAAMRSAMGNF